MMTIEQDDKDFELMTAEKAAKLLRIVQESFPNLPKHYPDGKWRMRFDPSYLSIEYLHGEWFNEVVSFYGSAHIEIVGDFDVYMTYRGSIFGNPNPCRSDLSHGCYHSIEEAIAAVGNVADALITLKAGVEHE
jgi:hypothetical protein